MRVEPSLEPDPEMEQTLEPFKQEKNDTQASLPPDALTQKLEVGKAQQVLIEGENRGLGMVVTQVAKQPRFGELQAPPGRQFLVFDVEFENRMALDLVTKLGRPEARAWRI